MHSNRPHSRRLGCTGFYFPWWPSYCRPICATLACRSCTRHRVSPPIFTGAGIVPRATSRQNVDRPMDSSLAASTSLIKILSVVVTQHPQPEPRLASPLGRRMACLHVGGEIETSFCLLPTVFNHQTNRIAQSGPLFRVNSDLAKTNAARLAHLYKLATGFVHGSHLRGLL